MNSESRKVPDFPRYKITSDGDVFNENGLKIKPEKTRNGKHCKV